MKSYTLLCFFLSLAMILSPLCSLEKTANVISNELFGESDAAYGENTSDTTVKIMSADSKNITETSLREYLIGAVAAEMNPIYHEEAIKAQAVASHTLLESSKRRGTVTGADITDDSAQHQGYLDDEAQRLKWGESYDRYRAKIEKCVDEVINYTVSYNGEVITAAFHAISNGRTENAAEVWGGAYPYLVSVESPGDCLSPAYSSALSVSADEFKAITEKQGATLADAPDKWLGEIKNTAAGTVKSIIIGGKEFKGTEIRKLFSLKSSTFACEYRDGGFLFSVSGYGHGVGMSQYGADFMARQGANYKEILTHYYPGTEIM